MMAKKGKRIRSNINDFNLLEQFTAPFDAAGRTRSAALLIWFLQTVYRLDEVAAEDAVCDRQHDEGIDALAVNDQQREVVVFQATRREKLPATLGDTELKKFVGSLAQFKTKSSVVQLAKQTKNQELARLLEKNSVAEKIKAGYTLRPIFVTNIAADENGNKYLPQAKTAGSNIELWDLTKLGPVLKQLSREWFVDEKVKVRTSQDKLFVIGAKSNPSLVYAAVTAKELSKLPGIEDLRIFSQNVRLGLGNTRVNSEIVDSLVDKKEHPNFIKFHNGLTIVSKELAVRGGTITLNDFSVCNGCQSLLSIWENRKKLTDSLEILVRVVRVGNDRQLPELIAYRTNNQNPITLRDLSANDSTQVHLKNEFDGIFSPVVTYAIKRGEPSEAEEIPNELAGRLLLALYVGEPWSAHQKYRIFGDLEGRIFNYDVSAPRIRLAQLISKRVAAHSGGLKYDRLAKYGLTHFILVYLVGELIRMSDVGHDILENPLPRLTTAKSENPKEAKLLDAVDDLVKFIVTELNYFIKEHGNDNYDYKTEFKSQKDIHTIRNEVQKAFEKDIAVGRAKAFAPK